MLNHVDLKKTGLYLSSQESMSFPELLEKVQSYLSENYKDLMVHGGSTNPQQTRAYIRQYLSTNQLTIEGQSMEQLVDRLYRETSEYSFLTPYLDFTIGNVENIEICGPDNVWIKYSDGTEEQSAEHFYSAEHARNVMNRLLENNHIHMDELRPLARGHLGKNIRITVNGGGGTLDDDVGITGNIRFVNPDHLTRDSLIQNGTSTDEMMDFLIMTFRYGLSMVVSGKMNAGKTTLLSIIMSCAVPNDKKLYTVEYETREFDLVKRDDNKRPINKVVSTVTRDNDDPKYAITPQKLLEHGLTENFDYGCMAEIKGAESFETMEASETGHPFCASTHAESNEECLERLVTLALLNGYDIDEKKLREKMAHAFPILIHSKKMEDGKRRITEISESTVENGQVKVIPLWEFVTSTNEIIEGKTVVHGQFVKRNVISEKLQQRLRSNGIPESLLQSFLKMEG